MYILIGGLAAGVVERTPFFPRLTLQSDSGLYYLWLVQTAVSFARLERLFYMYIFEVVGNDKACDHLGPTSFAVIPGVIPFGTFVNTEVIARPNLVV